MAQITFKDLPDLFDKIESKVRALKTVRIRQEQVGPSLVPIFLETLPNVIIFQISRNLRKDNWSTGDFLECINTEITTQNFRSTIKNDIM